MLYGQCLRSEKAFSMIGRSEAMPGLRDVRAISQLVTLQTIATSSITRKSAAATLTYEKGVSTFHSIAESMTDALEGIEERKSSAPQKYVQNENAVV